MRNWVDSQPNSHWPANGKFSNGGTPLEFLAWEKETKALKVKSERGGGSVLTQQNKIKFDPEREMNLIIDQSVDNEK